MPPFGGAAPPPLPLSERLRRDTASAHCSLEAELDLLTGLTAARLASVLQRFAGFHAGWEPVAARLLNEPALFEPRRRLRALHTDLARLQVATPKEAWTPPAWFHDRAAAWGSLYVLEGSTLGGQVIDRAVREAGLGGSAYFDGRGPTAGQLWRSLKSRLDDLDEPPERVTTAAVATFHALADWMRNGRRPHEADVRGAE